MNYAHPRPWLAGSDFGCGPRRKLCREGRRLFRIALDSARRAGRITALHAEVARAMLKRLGEDGRLDPSHATIAADAGCCDRTVRRALVKLAEAGLVTWRRRLVRSGWRVKQTSNAYELRTDGKPAPVRNARRCTGGQPVRETPSISLEEGTTADRGAAKEALARVADAMRERLFRTRTQKCDRALQGDGCSG